MITQDNSQTKRSPQNVLVKSYDKDFDILAVELLGYDGTNLQRLKTNNSGELQLDTASLDARYLKLDASNDPITGDLTIQPTNSTTAFQVNQADGTNVLTVDTIAPSIILKGYQVKTEPNSDTNLVLGWLAGDAIDVSGGGTDGMNNTYLGYRVGGFATSAHDNTGIGADALYTLTTGIQNTAVGVDALFYLTEGNFNTCVGYAAGQNITTGTNNHAFGVQALFNNKTGNSNFAIGLQSLFNITGSGNIGLGNSTLKTSTSGSVNVAIGISALQNSTVGAGNVAIGDNAGRAITTDSNNTFIGRQAGYTDGTTSTTATLYNASAFGAYAQVTQNSSLILGGTGTWAVKVGINTTAPTAMLDIVSSTSTTKGLIVKGAAAQSANLQEWQDSGGTILSAIEEDGSLGIGAVSTEFNKVKIHFVKTDATPTGVYVGTDVRADFTSPASQTTGQIIGILCQTSTLGTVNYGQAEGGRFSGRHSSTGTITNLYGGKFYATPLKGNATNVYGGFFRINPNDQNITITNAYVGHFRLDQNGASATITNGYGLYVQTPHPAGTRVNLYGLYLEDQNNATTLNYAIYTNAGEVHFGDKVSFTQTDGNEYIDSLADGYMDYRATTAHRFGDGTNQTLLASDGRMTMEGTARFWIGWEIDNTNFKEPPSQSATKVNRGLGTAYEYSDGQEEHIHATIRITGRWDHTENLEVILVWDSPTVSANCDWEVRYQFKAVDEDMTDTATTTVNCLAESSSTANGLVHSTCVIPASAFDAGDKILSLTIWRDGNDAADTLGASAYLHKMIVRGIANKLGGTVT